jgi:dipeptidyl aminopeptidase/acylaminoacyl peptidase
MESASQEPALFKTAVALAVAWYRPGENVAVDIGELAVSPDGLEVAGTCTVCDALEGVPATRIGVVDVASGALSIVTSGPRSDRLPRWSPDQSTLAFLSDRDQAYMFRLRLLDVASGQDRATTAVGGFVEYHQWSADGKSLLLGVAGYGADLAGAQGGFSLAKPDAERPSWAPTIDSGPGEDALRSVWVYDLASDTARQVSPAGMNVWEASWCGADAIAVVCSGGAGEELWYTATLQIFSLDDPKPRLLYTPADQIGWLSASPSGDHLALVEAVCSDRTIVAGDMLILDVATGAVKKAETLGADAVQTAWRGEGHVFFAAVNGPEALFGIYELSGDRSHEIWRGGAVQPSGARFPEAAPFGDRPGDCVFASEGYFQPQVLTKLENGAAREVMRFGGNDAAGRVSALGTARDMEWTAPDGRTIHGWLLTPKGEGPFPLVLEVHGGPVWLFRPRYVGRSVLHQLLVEAGYAILQVNPRGSSGRGQDFARQVFGDMGGADTFDYLSGLDALVEQGIVDPQRIGVTGGSYGGFMSSWLITQDQRFAAAVPVAPVTDWVSEHLTCHIPHFCETFLDDAISNPNGKYFTRSPIHFADRVKTPTLNICGALDKNTPAGQALEFHHALLLNGVKSVLATYPEEGHGVRKMPASLDYAARVAGWFQEHMPA